ncbi:hypothetical protein EU538_07335 [Candidatus Thorarchaeota archaeon]|nr:MAG: hypothetical protein EU538_07335 [Candidatus Thorarchaeota archaeon]
MPLENWRLLDLGALDALDTQVIYDMVAQAITEDEAENTLIICWPKEPLVCLGYFQEAEKDVDLEYCRKNNLLVVRRVIGGGGVYLDDGQLFYQTIGRIDSPTTPKNIDAYYRKFLAAPVQAYRNLGIDAEFKPVNDIQVNGKKISGNGAGDVGDARINTGNIIFDFDYESMVRVLKVPSEKFRDKIYKSLRERMTTIERETGSMPDRTEVKHDLIRLYEETLDIELDKGSLSSWEKSKMEQLREKYVSKDWLFWRKGRKFDVAHQVKISATASLGTSNFKAEGGLIRVTTEIVEGKIEEIVVSGDFFIIPSSGIEMLEWALTGAKAEREDILQRIKGLYSDREIQSPGVTPEDITEAVILAVKET